MSRYMLENIIVTTVLGILFGIFAIILPGVLITFAILWMAGVLA